MTKNPFDGIEFVSSKGPPATDAQLDYIGKLCSRNGRGMPPNFYSLTVGEASELIEALKEHDDPFYWVKVHQAAAERGKGRR